LLLLMLWPVSHLFHVPLIFLIFLSILAPEVNHVLTELDQSTTGTLLSRRARLVRAVGVLVQMAGGN
jgi:phosphate starvation-inducible membrane PsiE